MKMVMPKGKYIGTVRVGDKGQIVIPKELRALFDINPGDQLLILGDVKRGIALTGYDSCQGFVEKALGGEEEEKHDECD